MFLPTFRPSISMGATLLFATTAFAADPPPKNPGDGLPALLSEAKPGESLAQGVVFMQCTLFNGRVERIKLDPSEKRADILNSGAFCA